LQQALRECAAKLRAQGKPTLEARVGVNTGEVVMRTVETGGWVECTVLPPLPYSARFISST
jgi:class 3 adenylate cyclase